MPRLNFFSFLLLSKKKYMEINDMFLINSIGAPTEIVIQW